MSETIELSHEEACAVLAAHVGKKYAPHWQPDDTIYVEVRLEGFLHRRVVVRVTRTKR